MRVRHHKGLGVLDESAYQEITSIGLSNDFSSSSGDNILHPKEGALPPQTRLMQWI